jgi:hypothetical protein
MSSRTPPSEVLQRIGRGHRRHARGGAGPRDPGACRARRDLAELHRLVHNRAERPAGGAPVAAAARAPQAAAPGRRGAGRRDSDHRDHLGPGDPQLPRHHQTAEPDLASLRGGAHPPFPPTRSSGRSANCSSSSASAARSRRPEDECLERLVDTLGANGLECYHRRITAPESEAAGVIVLIPGIERFELVCRSGPITPTGRGWGR